jgi:bifunctional non-homologous end joining protein LigD
LRYRPQLATLVKSAPEGDDWLHEIKFDGYRIGCQIQKDGIRLISRNGNDWTSRFREIADAASSISASAALLDGEVAVMLPDGRTSFQALQQGGRGGPLTYIVFDLLHLDGEDLTGKPLETRKAALSALLARSHAGTKIRYSDHVPGNGGDFAREACRLGLEGIVSKRRGDPYRPGRSDGWVKCKCVKRQEFVIGGFTDPEGARSGIGALLVGFHEDGGRLTFSGKVGTGFTQKLAAELRSRLESIEQKESPFDPPPSGWLGRRAHWVRPELVAQVVFTEWTDDGKVRHPSFQGLREDKKAKDVGRERPAAPTAAGTPRPRENGTRVAGVALTNPDRVLYPELGFTKLDLAHYYESVADRVLPQLKGRPLTLVRCPEGLKKECFYMKHVNVWAPDALRRVTIREKKKLGEYLMVEDLAGLISLVQMNVLEIHTWNSTVAELELPDRIVFDIDPGPEVPPEVVVAAARLTRDLLDKHGLASFVKTTGGAGLHVVVPLEPSAGWDACLAFSRNLAQLIVEHDPRRYTITFRKQGREKKILMDYMRNNRASTSVAAFSPRARPRATVSVPLSWDELSPAVLRRQYTVRTLPKRLAGLKVDPWKGYWNVRQSIIGDVPLP